MATGDTGYATNQPLKSDKCRTREACFLSSSKCGTWKGCYLHNWPEAGKINGMMLLEIGCSGTMARNLTSNYAFKPIAELALRPNETIVPQRLNAALGLSRRPR